VAVGGASYPYWRLSSFYFFYFAFLGAWIPYWSLYLENIGYDARSIGLILAIVLGTKIVAPSLWGWLADRTRQRMKIIRLGSFLAVVCFTGIFLDQSLWWLALVVGAYSFFWNAVLAQFEVVTLSHLEDQYQRYSQIRLWGSVGFILAVAGLGLVFDYLSILALPWILVLLLAAIWFSSFFVAEKPAATAYESAEGLGKILRKPPVITFLISCFLLQIAHGPYYTFFSIYLEDHGYSRTVIGQLWGLGVFAEVLIFVFMPRLFGRFSLRHILTATLFLSVLRWLMIGFFVDNIVLLILAQCLHAATFGSFHAVGIELIRRFFKGGHEGQGQAIYSGVSFGAGGAAGALLAGFVWDSSSLLAFLLASFASLLALIASFIWVRGRIVENRP
jgi:PPP family 3-phenylpropionic acid transporter